QDLPDLSIIRIGDPKTSCVRQYVNDELAAIRGVCVSEVIIHVPREQLADLYINEIPQDSAAVVRQPISLSALRTGISRLSGASSGNLRKELLSEYLTRRPPSSKHLDDDEIHGLVMLTSSTDERMGMEQLIAVAEGLEPPSLPVVAPKLFVDIRDLDQFSPDSYPDASVILHSMQDDPEKFFPAGVSLDEVSGVEVQEIPSANVVRVNALILSKKAGRFFRKFELALGGNPRQVLGINASSDLALSKCQFTIRVGLVQRKAILEDEKHSIKKIYPLGVGGFDEGVKSASGGRTRLNTPLFHDGTLRESTAYAARTEPEYYQGKPFMPISTQDGTRTPISFHIYQDDTLVRGFISHGCMHLRDRNLQELYTILSRAKRQFIPVNVSYYIEDSEDSPYPFNNHEYTYVVNCAKKGEEPHSCKDPDLEGLTLLRYAEKQPPVSKLDMMGAPRYGVDFAVNGK
ncbi:MAG: L,D-transpeptidase family protein, partial [Bdellovibrionota bacterium]